MTALAERRVDRREYELLRARGIEARDQGLLRDALSHLEAALGIARQLADDELVDRAICNRAAVSISLGETIEATPELRQILIANRSPENSFLASYNLARCHELTKEAKKSLFYARIARDRAEDLGRTEWSYGALNQMANAMAAESRFDIAEEHYRLALALLPVGEPSNGLEARINLGYCQLMRGREAEGLGTLYRGLRDARRFELPRLEMIARLDLAWGTLERGRADLALAHVRRGLALAERSGDRDSIKKALYLEGEIWTELSCTAEAYETRCDLQRRFYPNQPEVAQYLMAINSRELINLRA